MKKWCLMLLVLLMSFSGCSSSNEKYGLDTKNPITLTVWHYYNGPLKTSFDSMVEDFNNTVGLEMGIVVDASSQGSVNELAQKVVESAEKKVGAEELPDVFAGYKDTVQILDHMGLIADLKGYFKESELSDYVEGYLQEGDLSLSQELKIFPIAKTTEIMMINKTDWDIFILENPDMSEAMLTTWESLKVVAERYYQWTDQLTEQPDDGKAFFGRDAVANYMLVGSAQLQHEIFKVENGNVVVDIDQDTFRKLWDNFYVPFVQGYYGAYGRFRSDDCKTGDLIALVGSSSGALYFPTEVMANDEESYPIESLVLPIPNFENTEPYAVQQGAGMAVIKGDESHEYAAAVFLKWFTEKERNISFSLSSGYLPVTQQANNVDVILEHVDDTAEISENLLKSLPVGIHTVMNSHLYTAAAFDGSAETRSILENSISDLAKQDYAEILQAKQLGLDWQAILDEKCSDAYFEAWFKEISEALHAAVKR